MNCLSPSIVLLGLPDTGATPAGSKTSQTKSSCGDPANPNEISTSDDEYTHTLKPYDVMIRSATRWWEQCAEPPP